MSGLQKEVDRLDFDYEEESVEVIPQVNIPDLGLDGLHFILIEKRQREIPYWIAEVLANRGLVVMDAASGGSFKTVKHLDQEQSKNYSLIELDNLTYRTIIRDLENLKDHPTSSAFIKAKSIESNFNKLIVNRTRKILDLVRTDAHIRNSMMSAEEHWFYVKMNSIYKEWKDQIGTQVNYDQLVTVTSLRSLSVPYDFRFENGEAIELTVDLQENQQLEIPLFLAERLEKHKYVIFGSRGFRNPGDLEEIEREEKRSKAALTKIHPLLYYFINTEVKRLKEEGTEFALMTANAYEGRLNYILRLRTRKILKKLSDDGINLIHMLDEEQLLFKQITSLFQEWKKMLGEDIFEEVF